MSQDTRGAVAARAAGLFLACLGFLPIVNWIPAGRTADWYGPVMQGFLSGGAIAIGVGLILAIASRRMPGIWPARWSLPAGAAGPDGRFIAIAAVVAFIAYAAVSMLVFDRRPLHIDEIVQAFQARIFAGGRLWLPSGPHPDFTTAMHVIAADGRTYGQFPPGGPAMLAVGELAGLGWLVMPALGAAAVALFGLALPALEPSRATRRGAVVLLALSPFMAFMSGTWMNHTATLAFLMLGSWGLVTGLAAEKPSPLRAFLGGLGFGAAATVRPTDAIAFALPAAAWYLWRSVRDRRRVVDMLASGAGVAIPIALLLWANWRTTGSPLLFAYQVAWGRDVGLGFHAVPWGEPHTPARGLELLSLYFLRLQTYLFELPLPSLLPAAAALLLSRRASPGDRYLLVASALLVGLYFAYWHDGFYLGPRFMFALLPVLALWTARLPGVMRDRFGDGLPLRTTVYAGLVAIVMGVTMLLPSRTLQYRTGLRTMRWNADSAAEAAGVRNAIVFVRESWGAEIMARLWAAGVSRSDAEGIYRTVDACELSEALDERELGLKVDPAAAAVAFRTRIARARADSSRLRALLLVTAGELQPDTTMRYLPGSAYTDRCRKRLREMHGGFTVFPPLLLARGNGNTYVRDLHEWNGPILAQYPGAPVYVLTQGKGMEDLPAYLPASRDSVLETLSPR